MENFRNKSLDGEWWLPDAPEHRYRATLKIDDRHHGELIFRGSEEHLASLPHGGHRHNFYGVLDNGYSYEVSLFNVGMKQGPSSTFPKQPGKETTAEFYTNNVLIGGHIASEDEPFLNGALVLLTGLDEWCDKSGFSGSVKRDPEEDIATETVEVTFKASSTPHYDVGDGRLIRFISEYRGPLMFDHRQSLELKQRNSINLTFSKTISIKDLLAEISIWQSFITLGLRSASYIEEITVLVHTHGENFTRFGLIVPGRHPETVKRRRSPREQLFSHSKLGDDVSRLLKAWRTEQERIEIAVLLFTGNAYQDAGYIHIHLLSYLQALEILHRETLKSDRFLTREARRKTIAALRASIPADLGEELRNEICSQMAFVGSLTLLDRLKHLLSLYPKSLKPLFSRGDQDMMLLKNVRNFLTHYSGQTVLTKDFLWSRDIMVLREKARLFVETCLLGAIGMSDDHIYCIMDQFDAYRDWRMETSMEFMNAMLKAKGID